MIPNRLGHRATRSPISGAENGLWDIVEPSLEGDGSGERPSAHPKTPAPDIEVSPLSVNVQALDAPDASGVLVPELGDAEAARRGDEVTRLKFHTSFLAGIAP